MGCIISCSTSHLGSEDLEDFLEVAGEGEGVLLLEWPVNLDLLAIHSSGPPSSAKMLKPQKLLPQRGGKSPDPNLCWQLIFRLE